MKPKYPTWIDMYIKSIHRLFRGMDLRTLEPLDCFHFHPLHSDIWQEHIYKAISKFKKMRLPFSEAVKAFPNPSSVRAIIQFMVSHNHNITLDCDDKISKQSRRETFNFFKKILQEKNKRDIFCYEVNIGHSKTEINNFINNIKWLVGSPDVSRELGKLYLGVSSLVNGLYNDWCTDNGIEVWGPYNTAKNFGSRTIFVIREFPRLKPEEIWPPAKSYKYKKIEIFTIYKNVKMKVEFVGCHTIFDGSLTEGLRYYALRVDGRFVNNPNFIKKLNNYYFRLSGNQYQRVRKLNFEELKQKVIEQELYQLKDFFQLVGMDFKPHDKFRERLKGRALIKGRYPLNTTSLSIKEIDKYFGIDNLKRLYLR